MAAIVIQFPLKSNGKTFMFKFNKWTGTYTCNSKTVSREYFIKALEKFKS